jgi:hypothetical protein
MGQMEMKCIFNIGKKYFYIGQGYSGERCGPWASCLRNKKQRGEALLEGRAGMRI